MELSERIRQFCSSHHLRLNRNLGQHFLINQEILDTIVETADIADSDHILEIGPGIGVLTDRLVREARHVTAIELDERFIDLVRQFTRSPDNLTVVQGNALHVPFPDEPYKIVANIPYHITSPLLRKAFLESDVTPTSLTLLIQREVAEKICDSSDAGMLTILVGLFGEPTLVTHVPPKCFLPPPKVDSAVLHIDCYKTPRTDRATIEMLFKLTKIAFGQKRKMLSNTLGTFLGGVERMESLGIDPKRRPQTLSIDEWIALAQTIVEN